MPLRSTGAQGERYTHDARSNLNRREDIMPTVVIVVQGGVAQLSRKPKNTRVIIRDYDTDGAEAEEERAKLKVDKAGDAYTEAVYE